MKENLEVPFDHAGKEQHIMLLQKSSLLFFWSIVYRLNIKGGEWSEDVRVPLEGLALGVFVGIPFWILASFALSHFLF